MGAQENLETAKVAYAAFSAGDAEKAMTNIADDIEWVTGGDSTVSGVRHGKQEVGELWSQMGSKSFTTEPEHWFADGDRVAVFTHQTLDGQSYDAADLLTYNSDGQLIKFQSAGGEQYLKDAFG